MCVVNPRDVGPKVPFFFILRYCTTRRMVLETMKNESRSPFDLIGYAVGPIFIFVSALVTTALSLGTGQNLGLRAPCVFRSLVCRLPRALCHAGVQVDSLRSLLRDAPSPPGMSVIPPMDPDKVESMSHVSSFKVTNDRTRSGRMA